MRALFALLVTAFCSHAVAETRIDASTENRFNRTLEQMKQELSAEKAVELNTAIFTLPFAGMKSFKDTPPDGVVKLDFRKLDGMTASQIIALAHSTVSVTIRVGDPPGLPERFRAPLRDERGQTPTPNDTLSLAGTEWDMTSNINGFISHDHVTLRPEGKLDDGNSSRSYWEQRGTAIKLAFNDNYAVYLGTIDGANFVQGSAGNINGIEWTWTARRSDSR
jgi:hypothetical protein